MSGAEVLSLISAIISIVDAAITVYQAASDASGLPSSFRDVAARLPLIRDTLATARTGLDEEDPGARDPAAHEAMKTCLEACRGRTEELSRIFAEVVPPAGASRLTRNVKAIRAMTKQGKVAALAGGIRSDLELLTANHAIRSATRSEMSKLIRTMEEATAAAPPAPPPSSPLVRVGKSSSHGDVYSNTGSGDLVSHSGVGDLNMSGGGSQFHGVFNKPFHITTATVGKPNRRQEQ